MNAADVAAHAPAAWRSLVRRGGGSRPLPPTGMMYGHPVTLVTDPGLELSMTRLLTAYGAQVNVVSEPHP